MDNPPARADITTRRIVCTIPGREAVSVSRNVTCRIDGATALTLDLYRPPGVGPDERTPAVVFVTGYPDAGMRTVLGCAPREMASYISWAELVAVTGMTGVTYAATDPVADAVAALEVVRTQGDSLGLDGSRVAVWACSGNVPNALGAIMSVGAGAVRAAALLYGYMLDLEGSSAVATAAAAFRFVNPCHGRDVDALPADVPVFIARAGADQMPGLNDSLDAFVHASLQRNRPVTLVNGPAAPHAFDILDDSDGSRAAIAQVVAFLRAHLGHARIEHG